MKSIYMPNDSFNSKDEINIINKLLSKLSRSILDDIDDKIEVWIIGNKDKDFFNSRVEIPMREHRILDPIDELPISEYREVQHIAVVNYKFSIATNVTREFLYGNTDYDVSDFITWVIRRLKNKFPKKKVRLVVNEVKEKYDKENNHIELLQKIKQTRYYYTGLIKSNGNKYSAA